MRKCFVCGGNTKESNIERVMRYKDAWDDRKVSSYFYVLETGGDIFTVIEAGYGTILATEITPNISKGAKIAHISEFNPNEL